MKMLMNEPVYLGPSILELTKISCISFWYDYVKLKHGPKAKFLYGCRYCIVKNRLYL